MSESWLSTQASESSTPEPPAPVMMTTLLPLGVGSSGMPRAKSRRSRSVRARITPDCLKTSS